MVHYTTAAYISPQTSEEYYMRFCSHHDKATMCALAIIIGFGALIAIYTLISVYLGG